MTLPTAALLTLALLADPQDVRETPPPAAKQTPAALVRAAAENGQLASRLTEPHEVEAILGPPDGQSTKDDGGMQILQYEYPGAHLMFGKFRDHAGPFTLRRVTANLVNTMPDGTTMELPIPMAVDIGQDQQLVLRNADDLSRLDDFWGFAGVSLANCDLTKHAKLVWSMTFDTRTVWPPPARLPEGFSPARLLRDGANPALGVRGLHERGIDGRGVRMAIIDQPLKPDHREFVDQLERYEEVGVSGVEPQMHGPPVASIAVGKTCGVAPAARLSYFAIPTWHLDNKPYCDAIERILTENEKLSADQRIRVVSISTAMFPVQANLDCWNEVTRRAADSGLLIVTCVQDAFSYGMLTRIPGADADDPKGYRAGRYGVTPKALLIPAGGRTTASHYGSDVYTYWTTGGLSWATPYLAGVAVLACQVDPDITPARIIELLQNTAVRSDAGRIIQPEAFIEAVQREKE